MNETNIQLTFILFIMVKKGVGAKRELSSQPAITVAFSQDEVEAKRRRGPNKNVEQSDGTVVSALNVPKDIEADLADDMKSNRLFYDHKGSINTRTSQALFQAYADLASKYKVTSADLQAKVKSLKNMVSALKLLTW